MCRGRWVNGPDGENTTKRITDDTGWREREAETDRKIGQRADECQQTQEVKHWQLSWYPVNPYLHPSNPYTNALWCLLHITMLVCVRKLATGFTELNRQENRASWKQNCFIRQLCLKGKIHPFLCGCLISVDGKSSELKQQIPAAIFTEKTEFSCRKICCFSCF